MGRRRILFAGNFHWNAGSSHMIAEYATASETVGCKIGVSTQLARMDAQVRQHLPLIDELRWATHLVCVFEGRQFLSDTQLELCQQIPRHRRLVIDPDGHWGPTVTMGADSSNGNYTADSWRQLYTTLADLILQPKIGGALPPGAEFFSYFGMPHVRRVATHAPPPDRLPYQLQYIGSNWWRWHALTDLVHAALAANPRPHHIRVCGRWWDGQTCAGHKQATVSDPGWLSSRGVEVGPPVPFGHVVSEMGRSAITPILARPVLAKMELLTPRMFETLASGSIPALTNGLAYLESVYGDRAQLFCLGDEPSKTLAEMLGNHDRYRRELAQIQDQVYAGFNYYRVLTHLLTFLQ